MNQETKPNPKTVNGSLAHVENINSLREHKEGHVRTSFFFLKTKPNQTPFVCLFVSSYRLRKVTVALSPWTRVWNFLCFFVQKKKRFRLWKIVGKFEVGEKREREKLEDCIVVNSGFSSRWKSASSDKIAFDYYFLFGSIRVFFLSQLYMSHMKRYIQHTHMLTLNVWHWNSHSLNAPSEFFPCKCVFFLNTFFATS